MSRLLVTALFLTFVATQASCIVFEGIHDPDIADTSEIGHTAADTASGDFSAETPIVASDAADADGAGADGGRETGDGASLPDTSTHDTGDATRDETTDASDVRDVRTGDVPSSDVADSTVDVGPSDTVDDIIDPILDSGMDTAADPDVLDTASADVTADAAPVDACEAAFCCSSDTDCDDRNVCNGLETCDPSSRACMPGVPLACAGGVPCVVYGCDPTAGCTATADAARCNDGFSCTTDSCDLVGGCSNVPDSTRCAPALGCFVGSCIGSGGDAAGCLFAPNDMACDDGKACTADSFSASCVPSSTAPTVSCETTGCRHAMIDADSDGFSANAGCGSIDCNDGNGSVFPGNSSWYVTPITPGGSDWDYNCSAAAEKQYPSLASCKAGCALTSGPGWSSGIPACGVSGSLITACDSSSGGCSSFTRPTAQGCH